MESGIGPRHVLRLLAWQLGSLMGAVTVALLVGLPPNAWLPFVALFAGAWAFGKRHPEILGFQEVRYLSLRGGIATGLLLAWTASVLVALRPDWYAEPPPVLPVGVGLSVGLSLAATMVILCALDLCRPPD